MVVDFVIVGPSTDHLGSPYSYYLYMEVSGRQRGEKARILTTPRFQGKYGETPLHGHLLNTDTLIQLTLS